MRIQMEVIQIPSIGETHMFIVVDKGENRRLRWCLNIENEVPGYQDNLRGDDFMFWVESIKRIFEYWDIPDEHKVELVGMQLRGWALALWEQTMVTRGVWKLQSDTWETRKSLICEAFLLVDYVQFLLKPL